MSATAEHIGKKIPGDRICRHFNVVISVSKTCEKLREVKWSLFSIIPLPRND